MIEEEKKEREIRIYYECLTTESLFEYVNSPVNIVPTEIVNGGQKRLDV